MGQNITLNLILVFYVSFLIDNYHINKPNLWFLLFSTEIRFV